ncbi:prenyltransferase/squalene oxidase repeat-containing protein [Streptacidiphilus jiangxiensis]|uniref:Squalene-hopene cyclase C-terminal domain-containing protein n=1 Tax=Streptacidiphilus jiangxiensis TaxID=235985 RepID=A0A1H7VYS9_STRJI|nr:prenyltransferase/squalene oxidase repeat-containing protein [Streptacidiphilus jiangxiensis]SEM13945.1 Squalene-hopene cyclase C-terminal domain-containing protein [Streptacidiphilus jiangxiensis]
MLSAVRRPAALVAGVLTATALLGAAAPSFADASASASAAPLPTALYGKGDPTYDGVWRQSLSLIALHAQGVTPAADATDWLAKQQCSDGGWSSYNADASKPCVPATEDTNATSVAIQALVALGGHDDAVAKAVAWYKNVQNKDGGWSYNPGTASDANSTSLVVSALAAAKVDPASVAKDGKSAVQGLAAFQLGCSTPAAQQGAYAYQPDKSGKLAANGLASAQGAIGAEQAFLPVVASAASAASSASCGDSAASAANYLAAQLKGGQEHLTQQLAGAAPSPDYAATAWAVLALAHQGRVSDAQGAMAWLKQNAQAWTQGDHGQPQPSALALLVLAAQATGTDATQFGTTNLVAQLESTGPAPAATPGTHGASAAASSSATAAPKQGGTGNIVVFIALLIAGVGVGLLVSSWNRKRLGKRA